VHLGRRAHDAVARARSAGEAGVTRQRGPGRLGPRVRWYGPRRPCRLGQPERWRGATLCHVAALCHTRARLLDPRARCAGARQAPAGCLVGEPPQRHDEQTQCV
jgi:hypothetical protein